MHFEILIEDRSGKELLDIIVPKIIGEQHTFRVISYRGIGKIPKNLQAKTDPNKRILLDRLPGILRGYGKTYEAVNKFSCALIVVCDLDDKCLKEFKLELLAVFNSCCPKPETRFCIAVEEGEAWLLGDISAIIEAYPKAVNRVLNEYKNDSICGTWERLADAVYPKGSLVLCLQGYQKIGEMKSEWARNISPHIDINNNKSPSFCYFRNKLMELT